MLRLTARRAAEIEPFEVMDVLARAHALEAAGRRVVHMEIGEPDFTAPAPVVEAGVQALRDGLTAYTDRKSTRLNSSHGYISYAVFCLKKKKKKNKNVRYHRKIIGSQ